MKNNIEIPEPALPSRLQRDGYAWTEQTIEEISTTLSDKLKNLKAKCWMIDVHAKICNILGATPRRK